jgi:hypothetical protein
LKLRPARRLLSEGCVRLARPHAQGSPSTASAAQDQRSLAEDFVLGVGAPLLTDRDHRKPSAAGTLTKTATWRAPRPPFLARLRDA